MHPGLSVEVSMHGKDALVELDSFDIVAACDSMSSEWFSEINASARAAMKRSMWCGSRDGLLFLFNDLLDLVVQPSEGDARTVSFSPFDATRAIHLCQSNKSALMQRFAAIMSGTAQNTSSWSHSLRAPVD